MSEEAEEDERKWNLPLAGNGPHSSDRENPYTKRPGGVLRFAVIRGDMPTFRVDFLTQNILDKVQIWVSTKYWEKKNILDWVENWVSAMNYFKNSFQQGDFFHLLANTS